MQIIHPLKINLGNNIIPVYRAAFRFYRRNLSQDFQFSALGIYMFSIKDRNIVSDYVLELAASDPRVVAGAVVGLLALSDGDRWSDLDLTFTVADDFPVSTVLENWTGKLIERFDAAHLFDLPSGASIYRVFLLPGCLQFDLSFTPASKFGATGPKFKLLFGAAVEKPQFHH